MNAHPVGIFLVLGLSALWSTARAGTALKVGDVAPAFSLPASDGKTYASKDLLGKTVVLYFYPKDETPGCTKEACAFRDRNAEIQSRSAVVLGINTDSVESHKKFVEKYKLTFPLLSDESKATSKAYGALGMIGFSKRVTFILDPEGKIARIFADVKVDGHAEEILKALDEMKKS